MVRDRSNGSAWLGCFLGRPVARPAIGMASRRGRTLCRWALPALALVCCLGCDTAVMCQFANDGVCDDGRTCSGTNVCAFGTDVADCAGVTDDCDLPNSCQFANDGECDDGRPGSVSSICNPGTDFNDCGP